MKKHTYQQPRGTCVACGKNKQMAAGMQNGFQRWKQRCHRCHRQRYAMTPCGGKSEHRRFLGDKCLWCGFVPEHPCQLDVDHIDGNHGNNDPSNLQTLCANCHRLKTLKSRDGIYQGHYPRIAGD